MSETEPTTDETGEAPHGLDEFGQAIGVGANRTVRAPWSRETVGHARSAITADLKVRGVSDEIIEEAVIVVSELVTNALRHATPLQDETVRIKWKAKGDIVEIEVSDGGSEETSPKPLPRQVWASNGRGLRIVRNLAHEWGVQENDKGVTVWACLGGPSRRRVATS